MEKQYLDKALETKLDALCRIIKTHGKVAVAYSGGVDSAFLAFIVNRELGQENAPALIADTSLVPQFEIDIAIKTAETMGLNFKAVTVNPFSKEFVENPPDRCYHCKKIIFTELIDAASQMGFDILVDGSNADDTNDYRPGLKALAELGVSSPLMEAGLVKSEIRTLSRHFDLPTADMMSSTCLATRIPYYTEIDTAKLKAVKKSEAVLFKLGFSNFRVRYHGDIARIEVQLEQMDKLMECRNTIIDEFKKTGFLYVTVDLAGYRSGSMNESLKENGDEY